MACLDTTVLVDLVRPAGKWKRRALEAAIRPLGVLDFDDRAARLFGQITAHVQRVGKPAGDMDVLIAATSMSAGHALVTRNPAHFAGIPDLAVEGY